MRKLLTSILALMILVGCSGSHNASKESIKKYNEYIQMIEDNKDLISSEIPFDHSLEVVKKSDKLYEYTITIDNPKIAMYNIEEIIVDKHNLSGDYVSPNVGIIDDEDAVYNMIPFQSNKDKGFQKGIKLSGESTKSNFTLYVAVTWKDYAKLKTSKVFFHYSYDYNKEIEKEQTKAADE